MAKRPTGPARPRKTRSKKTPKRLAAKREMLANRKPRKKDVGRKK